MYASNETDRPGLSSPSYELVITGYQSLPENSAAITIAKIAHQWFYSLKKIEI